jgi:hypothetical protein
MAIVAREAIGDFEIVLLCDVCGKQIDSDSLATWNWKSVDTPIFVHKGMCDQKHDLALSTEIGQVLAEIVFHAHLSPNQQEEFQHTLRYLRGNGKKPVPETVFELNGGER